MSLRYWPYSKGHGTLNDFVLVTDRHGMVRPSAADVRWLCDRRAGIGADGLIRAVKASAAPGWDGDPHLWFMDYRNADGSVAEVCGNGLRVFARYLLEQNLFSGTEIDIVTRAGLRHASIRPDGQVAVTMGPVTLGSSVRVTIAGGTWSARTVSVGNPHAVVLLAPGRRLAPLDLCTAPAWEPADAFPDGVNVEIVRRLGERTLAMRVYERGSGETMSCGTGTVAAAAVAAAEAGDTEGMWRVKVRGGAVEVKLSDGHATLTGPAVIVASGNVTLPDQAEAESPSRICLDEAAGV